jgi:hypothetical protein
MRTPVGKSAGKRKSMAPPLVEQPQEEADQPQRRKSSIATRSVIPVQSDTESDKEDSYKSMLKTKSISTVSDSSKSANKTSDSIKRRRTITFQDEQPASMLDDPVDMPEPAILDAFDDFDAPAPASDMDEPMRDDADKEKEAVVKATKPTPRRKSFIISTPKSASPRLNFKKKTPKRQEQSAKSNLKEKTPQALASKASVEESEHGDEPVEEMNSFQNDDPIEEPEAFQNDDPVEETEDYEPVEAMDDADDDSTPIVVKAKSAPKPKKAVKKSSLEGVPHPIRHLFIAVKINPRGGTHDVETDDGSTGFMIN